MYRLLKCLSIIPADQTAIPWNAERRIPNRTREGEKISYLPASSQADAASQADAGGM